jgi:uncharacterized protein (TIGR02588 family)
MTKMTGGKNIEADEPHWIEWVTGAVSAVIVIAVMVWIAKDAIADRDASPNLVGSVVHVQQRSGGYQVQFEVRNSASATASQVTVRGEVRDDDTLLETTETVVDYVPGHSKANGGLIFLHDPGGKTIHIRATAYNDP